MDSLPLPLIGWVFTLASAAALLIGAWMIIGVHRSNAAARRQLAARVLDDSVLFGIWILGLAGGIGVLLRKSWAPMALQLFCVTLVVLIVLSSWNRLRASTPPRTLLVASLLLFAVPILVLCVATVLTLRGDSARAVFG